VQYARHHRKNATQAEQVLWAYLRRHQQGFKVRKQHILLARYIADFYVPSAQLVIEVDGLYHNQPGVMRGDEDRTCDLIDAGYRVVRFTNTDVMCDLRNVLVKICEMTMR
jgi:very-short-patch-repair endonuclease